MLINELKTVYGINTVEDIYTVESINTVEDSTWLK